MRPDVRLPQDLVAHVQEAERTMTEGSEADDANSQPCPHPSRWRHIPRFRWIIISVVVTTELLALLYKPLKSGWGEADSMPSTSQPDS
jgi:hypothetical protein